MLESFTAAAQRAIDRAEARARRRGAAVIEPADLLAALVDESESRAAELLTGFGLEPERVWTVLGTDCSGPRRPGIRELMVERFAAVRRTSAVRVERRSCTIGLACRSDCERWGPSTCWPALLSAPGPLADQLAAAGLELAAVTRGGSPTTVAAARPDRSPCPSR